jgi:hypothetical protein
MISCAVSFHGSGKSWYAFFDVTSYRLLSHEESGVAGESLMPELTLLMMVTLASVTAQASYARLSGNRSHIGVQRFHTRNERSRVRMYTYRGFLHAVIFGGGRSTCSPSNLFVELLGVRCDRRSRCNPWKMLTPASDSVYSASDPLPECHCGCKKLAADQNELRRV